MTYEEVQKAMGSAAAVVKLICAVGNNAAWVVMMDAYDHAKKCQRWNQSAKGGRVSGQFKTALREWKIYERNLLRRSDNRMFHLADMGEDVRRKYGNITDDEYYEFWKGVGAVAHSKSKPMITSLWNKYRLSLERHHVADAEHVAWVMTAQAAIQLSLTMYESALQECITGYKLPRPLLEKVFGQFSLKRLSVAWYRAMMALAPDTEPIKLESDEEKNIDLGLHQLMEVWMDPDTLYGSAAGAVDDYEEIFATKGFVKKVQREIAEVRADTLAELNK